MTDIDLTTGLPILPEGQFWRVRKRNSNWSFENYIAVEIVEKTTVERFRTRKFLWFTINRPPVFEEEDVVLNTGIVWDPNRPITGEEEISRAHLTVTVVDKTFHALNPLKLTSEDVLQTAERVIEIRDRNVAAEKLLGDYPPKTLNPEKN